MAPFDKTYMTLYSRSTVTMGLSPVISEIFDSKNTATLKYRFIQGHWQSRVPFDRSDMISY